ncbi:plastin-3-like isoform X2 [Symsagittifera roscoffensis]|uniref:plastin-3-like isoform X2 n=1 Tax=Symsagittifera roscoffensis TaxID=84072 RepID=UPI00307C9806
MSKVPETWRQNLTGSGAVDEDHLKDLEEKFKMLDTDGNGSVTSTEVRELFKSLGEDIPAYKCREYIQALDKNKNGTIEMEEFLTLFAKHQMETGKDKTRKLSQALEKKSQLVQNQGKDGAVHSYAEPEKRAFAEWINQSFKDDPILSQPKYLPIDASSEQLFQRVHDGIILIKVINKNAPDTIDERVMHKSPKNEWQMRENHELALNSASSIGCCIVNMGAADMVAGTPHLVLGILWQIIKIGLTSKINLNECPGLACLLEDGETMHDLQSLSPEELLLRWVNFHLSNAGVFKRIRNFSDDIKDSEAYIWLLHQIAPPDLAAQMVNSQAVFTETDFHRRAEMTLDTADVLKCRAFIAPTDIVDGNPKLNLAFVANLFNNYPALDGAREPIEMDSIVQETREEKTFRNWINSLGLKAFGVPLHFVNHLFYDVTDGLVILAIEDQIAPGVVEWKNIKKPPIKMEIFKRQNCQYAVGYAKGDRLKLKTVGIGGDNLFDQSEEDNTLKLGLIWQLMRAYTGKILLSLQQSQEDGSGDTQKDIDKSIIEFVNNKLSQSGKQSSVSSFKDSSISTSLPIIDLIDAIKPRVVDYTLVNLDCASDSAAKFNNAKLAINWGRKVGARIYALPDDIVEVKPKMVLTVFACLMTRALQNK